MACQGAIVAMSPCEAEKFVLARFEGPTPMAPGKLKTDTDQRLVGG